MIKCKVPGLIAFPYVKIEKWNLFFVLIFFYFLTLSGDQLHLQITLFKCKMNHLLATGLFVMLACSGRLQIAQRSFLTGFLALLSSILISTLVSFHMFRSAGYLAVYLFTYAVYFLVPLSLMLLVDKEKLLRVYLFSFFVIGAHAALQFLISFFGVYDPFVKQLTMGSVARGQSWTYEPSFYALYAMPFVFFCNLYYLLSSKDKSDSSSLVKIILINFCFLASTSTSAFFSYFVFFLTLVPFYFLKFRKTFFPLLSRRLWKFAVVFFAIFSGAGLFFSNIFIDTFYKFFHVGFFSHVSFVARWNGIVAAWEVFCEHPFFGAGIGGVGPFLYLKELYNSADVVLTGETLDMLEPFDPTNVFTEVLASLGVYGMAVLAAIGFFVCRLFLRALSDARISEVERKTIFALFISAIVMIVCLQFNQGLFRSYIWVHMGMSIGYVLRSIERETLSQER